MLEDGGEKKKKQVQGLLLMAAKRTSSVVRDAAKQAFFLYLAEGLREEFGECLGQECPFL